MKTVAIVSEFNPFHNGHKYCIDEVRRHFGEDTCIIALMSGNYTQRGDVAVADKFTRAAAAVVGGVDLVLEVPFPFSVSSAEYYADAAVSMADSLGVVDALAFGSECGDLSRLLTVSECLSSAEYAEALRKTLTSTPALGYARAVQAAYASLYKDGSDVLLSSPNDTLAVRYLAANRRLGTPLEPFAVKRLGGYHDATLLDGVSATAIRAAIERGELATALGAMPPRSAEIFRAAVEDGRAPAALSRLGNVFLSFFRLAPCPAADDLSGRLHSAALSAADLEEFFTLVATKHYTHAYLRRTLWHRLFGITSAELRMPPAYTQVLAHTARGRAALRRASRLYTLALLTKPADGQSLEGEAGRQAALSQRADLLYPLAMPRPVAGNAAMKAAPFCEG
ncbi:MAG: nucleotidyltransferase family protein [Clostridia bacterium]|nr:nucleotidyltransferase family protein [Clostridia bacterium]